MNPVAKFRLGLITAAGLLAGCGSEIPPDDYFPLQEGVTWTYQVTEDLTDYQIEREFSITNMGPADLGGDYENEPVYLRRTSDGTDYYLLSDDSGIYRVAKRTLIEFDPRYEPAEVRVFPNPGDIDLGRVWSANTRAYALHSVASFAVDDPGDKDIEMEYEISSIDASVTVPAGTFDKCIEVTGTAIFPLYADPRLGYQDVFLTQKEWYAPGVGLVKLTREEPLDLEIFKGGLITFELQNIQIQ